ncbi:similar to Saccharomyces cerevisiae YJR129C EFM3 Putative protein of unknown function [Maudiozyma saulgeensis]|uniref:FAM86 N-terminal domain-containing protein n=1 Tax=Maudiozyma saulgeensis TaxID=1789683 RepID=A0A1X7R8I6_9SACH|nr:similar to Saccharomyces cerevisiae YJR129C EFM3 Putative protein of unknown function [Kazachstania saulgeensis]
MNIVDQLYARRPVETLSFDSETAFETLRDQLLEIKQINAYYVKKVLKRIIDLGLYIDDTDWIYDEYVTLLNVTDKDQYSQIDSIRYFFKNKYEIDGDRIYVDIYEKPNLISASGTTGFRTWEASLFLCEYILQNEILFKDQNILELGCGTGICSILLEKMQYPQKIYVTDGDSELISNQLVRNFELNKISRDNNSNIVLQRLWWNEDKIPNDIDIVIGADITFDASLFDSLCQCLLECLTYCKICLISATIRNQDTTDSFILTTKKLGMKIEEISRTETLENTTLLAPVVIYKISK